jgi:hypothetical protein
LDAKLMVATDRADVKKLIKEDARDVVVMTMETAQSPAGRIINPLLLASAHFGSWKALNFLLAREDARRPPMMIPTQEFLGLLSNDDMGRIAASAVGGDEEEGIDVHEPAPPAVAGPLLKGVTPDGDTALHVVASHGDGKDFLEYARIICERGRHFLFAKNYMGDTPLHCAVRAGHSKIVSCLIALAEHEGADSKLKLLRMENERHETALHDAVRIEDGRVLRVKDRPALLTEDAVPASDADGAAEEKNMVKLLMDADPELANYPAEGISPLCLAILMEKDTIAIALYKKSGGGNLSYSGPDGQNALHGAVLRATNTGTHYMCEICSSLKLGKSIELAKLDKFNLVI